MNNNKSEIKKGILSGTGSGIVTTICCVGPLIIILLGLGTFSLALSVSQYRPYFIALGIFFLLLSIFLHLRKKSCCSVEGLKREKSFIVSAILSMGIIYLGALYVVVPAISPLVYEDAKEFNPMSTDAVPEISDTKISNGLEKLTLKIGGMTCQNCADIIEGGLRELDGVVEVKVSYSKEVGEVTYDPGKITKEQIVNSDVFSRESGYAAELISDESLKTTLS